MSGTLSGLDAVQKLVEVNGRSFDLRAEGTALLLDYPDRPGVMGTVGTLLGEAGVNIEAAQISQTKDGSDALMLLRVDRAVDADVLESIGAAVGAHLVRSISFDLTPGDPRPHGGRRTVPSVPLLVGSQGPTASPFG